MSISTPKFKLGDAVIRLHSSDSPDGGRMGIIINTAPVKEHGILCSGYKIKDYTGARFKAAELSLHPFPFECADKWVKNGAMPQEELDYLKEELERNEDEQR